MSAHYVIRVIKVSHHKKTTTIEGLLFPNKLEFITYKLNSLVVRRKTKRESEAEVTGGKTKDTERNQRRSVKAPKRKHDRVSYIASSFEL